MKILSKKQKQFLFFIGVLSLLIFLLFFFAGCTSQSYTPLKEAGFEGLSSAQKEKAWEIVKEYGKCPCGDCDKPLETCDCGEADVIKEKVSQGVRDNLSKEAILKLLKEGRRVTPVPLLTTRTLPKNRIQTPSSP
jgi:hypothetical protein